MIYQKLLLTKLLWEDVKYIKNGKDKGEEKMLLEMSIVDIIQSVTAVLAIGISVIGIGQSKKANKVAEKSNDIAEKANVAAQKALVDSQKDYMPLVRFCDKINVVSKSIKMLRNEITFDFEEQILDLYNNSLELDDIVYLNDREESEIFCITTKIQNCGSGIITGMKITGFAIQSGNKIAMDIRSQEELETMCCNFKIDCKEDFVLLPEEDVTINFIVVDTIKERHSCETLDDVKAYIHKFVQENDNITISMSLELDSINDTSYKQEFLTGTYYNQQIIHNSFYNALKK